jgi:tetratricopeptide (TPR) repeat protein
MRIDTRASDFFVAGGTLHPDAPSYVKRPADDELFDLTLAGKFCYVLTPRQMGKSSLMVRTAHRLQEQGAQTAIIDLTSIGTDITGDQWYLSLLTQLKRRLRLSVDPVAWWQARASLGHVQRFTDFLRDVILTEVEEQVVIFVDEIDTTLNLDFRDDFFAAIRAMYNARADDPEFDRLTFVLLGVASPPDLIKDRARTPFNIGQGIALQEFTQTDAAVLQAELETLYPGQGEAIFAHIYHWTNGHPYLTQKLCLAVAETGYDRWTNEQVDNLVERLFLSEEARRETNLQFVRDKILSHPRRRHLLALYRKVYAKKKIGEDKRSLIQTQLKLSGLVKAENGCLHVRNEIYRRAFDSAWVRENASAVAVWRSAVVGVTVGIVVSLFLAVAAILYNSWVGIQFQDCIVSFYQANATQERVAHLARAFRLRGLFGLADYSHRAREAFYGLPREEQLTLLKSDDVEGSDSIVVIRGLYVALADTDAKDSTGPLLQAMSETLESLEETDKATNLRKEIDSWRKGRELVRQNLYPEALVAYNRAIALNSENPATLYERARVLIELQEYQQALSDLKQVIAISERRQASNATIYRLDTNDDGNMEEVVFYCFDLPAESEHHGLLTTAFVFQPDHGLSPSVIPHELRAQGDNYLCECTCSPAIENVLSQLEGPELVIRDRCGEETSRLTIFHWDKDQRTYLPKGQLVGMYVEVDLNKVTLQERMPGLAQLSSVITCRARDNRTYYQPGSQGIPVLCKKEEIVFSYGEPEDVLCSPYPEEVVLAFYNHYNDDETAPMYFTEKVRNNLGKCAAGECGCIAPRHEITHVRVTYLHPETYTEAETPNPDRVSIGVRVVCQHQDVTEEVERYILWHLVREGDRWHLERPE